MNKISILIPTSPSVQGEVDFDYLRMKFQRSFGLKQAGNIKFRAIYFCLGKGFTTLSDREDIEVHYIGFRTGIWIIDLFISFLFQLLYLSRWLFKGKCIIFISTPYLGLAGAFLRKIFKKVVLCVRVMGDTPSHLREVSGEKFSPFVLLKIEEFVLKTADIIIANAEFTKSLALKRGAKEERIVFVSSPVFNYKEPEQREVEDLRRKFSADKIVLCVARLIKLKGIHHLITAFKRVLENFPDCKLVIVGDGGCKGVLEELASYQGIKDKVFFEWGIPHNEVFKYYWVSDIFVLPSIGREGRPVVLMEAGLCNKPLVATFNAGRDVIKDGGNGFLVPQGDEEKLAEKNHPPPWG